MTEVEAATPMLRLALRALKVGEHMEINGWRVDVINDNGRRAYAGIRPGHHAASPNTTRHSASEILFMITGRP